MRWPIPSRELPLLVVPLLVFAACSSTPSTEKTTSGVLFFPAPPDPPRVQYLTSASGAAELSGEVSALDRFIGADAGTKPRLNKPFGLAARNGSVYVCDTQDGIVVRLDFAAMSHSVLGASGEGRLKKPINIAIDPLGYKFVADVGRNEIVVFGPNDQYVAVHKLPQPCRVVDVDVFENELYVLDNDSTPAVVVLDRSSGAVLRTLGGRGNEAGKFNAPAGLSVSPDGYVYVSDAVSCRIQKLRRDGTAEWSKGSQGFQIGQFGRPRGIRAAPGGVIYVADAATEIVQLWNSEGRPLMHLGGPGGDPGALVLPSGVAVDATSLPTFRRYLHPDFEAEYLIFVASQFGDHMVSVYAFGKFPEGYQLRPAELRTIPIIPPSSETLITPTEEPPPKHPPLPEAPKGGA